MQKAILPDRIEILFPMHASALAPCVRPFFAALSLSRWGKLFSPLTTDEGPVPSVPPDQRFVQRRNLWSNREGCAFNSEGANERTRVELEHRFLLV